MNCATDPILLQNEIRSQVNSIQYVTPKNLLSPKFTIPVCGHKQILKLPKKGKNTTTELTEDASHHSFVLSHNYYLLENIGEFSTQCEKYIQQLD